MSPTIQESAQSVHCDYPDELLALPRMTTVKIIRDVIHGHKAHAFMLLHITYQTLQHQKHLGPPRHIGVYGDREDGVVILAIHPVELITPHFLQVARVHKTMAIR